MPDDKEWSEEEQEQLKKAFGELDKFQEKVWQEHSMGIPRPKHFYYMLDENKNPVPCGMYEFAMQQEQFEKYKRVALTQFGPYKVSTVFLCIDHNFGGEGPPVLFETMIWSIKTGEQVFFDYQTRYCTWAEALEGHDTVCHLVREGILP